MALLEIQGLTVRFGGLTAVQRVDFAVEEGRVVSLIGPNGAGKTTVFNAVTGVYEPTEGEVFFRGAALRLPFRPRVAGTMAFVGLVTGLGLAALSANIDAAWRTVVVLNYADPGEPFPVGKAVRDLWSFLNARVMPEREVNRLTDIELREKDGRRVIRSTTTRAVLESHADAAEAERRLEVVQAMVNLAGSARTTAPGDGRWIVRAAAGSFLDEDEAGARRRARDIPGATVERAPPRWHVLSPDNRQVLETFDSREEAKRRLLDLAVQAGKVRWRLATRASAKPLGTSATPGEAAEAARAIEEMIAMGAAAPVEEREGRAVVLSADRARPLASFEDRRRAQERLAELSAAGGAMDRARAVLWLSFVLGCAVGAGGAFAVWRRARRTPDVIARRGLARTFQNIRLFPEMRVVENVLVGMGSRLTSRAWQSALRTPGFRAEERSARARAMDILGFVGLERRAADLARNLPYGDQRRLEIARALATEPRLLLLDEPAAGMNPAEAGELMKLIRRIRDRGVTVLLIEHHMKVVMGISDRIVVLDYGSKIAEGTPDEIQKNPKVIEVYLGKADDGAPSAGGASTEAPC